MKEAFAPSLPRCRTLVLGMLLSFTAVWTASAQGTSLVVTRTTDGGLGFLRDAMLQAQNTPGTTITFNISQIDSNFTNGTWVIRPQSPLPELGPETTIDGASGPADTNPVGPQIVINGSFASSVANGLVVTGRDCVIKELVIQGFRFNGIVLSGNQATGCRITGCYIGTNASATGAVPNGDNGIAFIGGANGNTIGGDAPDARNVISGNSRHGISIDNCRNNVISGNFIGVSRIGTTAIRNQQHGIWLDSSASSNMIGSLTSGAPNVISGNGLHGIFLEGASDTTILRNYIGLGSNGSTAVPNVNGGIWVDEFGNNNVIGGADAAARNVISGNSGPAIQFNAQCTGNVIQGNTIGLDVAGIAARPNQHGIDLGTTRQTQVLSNVISGNQGYGIVAGRGLRFSSTGNLNLPNENQIKGNVIGLNAAGTHAIGNRQSGIYLSHLSWGNTIGGATPIGVRLRGNVRMFETSLQAGF